jgi:hypothetical protein
MLERPGMTPEERDQECQNLAERQSHLVRAGAPAGMQQVAVRDGRKVLAAIVDSAEDSNQLVQRGFLSILL